MQIGTSWMGKKIIFILHKIVGSNYDRKNQRQIYFRLKNVSVEKKKKTSMVHMKA